MSELNLKIGQPVEIVGKNLKGHIAYIGFTNFSTGKWIGVVLNEECKGKNNGTVRGVTYFRCPLNRGIFLRPHQLIATTAMDINVNGLNSATALASDAAFSTADASNAERQQSDLLECDDTPTSSANLLKTTKINQPKQPKQFLSSSSQLQLHVSVNAANFSRAQSGLHEAASTTSALVATAPPKRSASFVETGFLEILRPRFTPGQALRSPTMGTFHVGGAGSNSGINNSSSQCSKCKENELKIIMITEENENLRKQRTEDKGTLLELEKIKIQNEQLMEFKSKIMEQHSMLQRELQRSRQETRDSNDSIIKYKRELSELADTTELLTLDKEMAEERAETFQMELELAQEHIYELQLDVEILRAENENNVGESNTDATVKQHSGNMPTIGELKKVEQHNHRLRETVVRLRDVLTQEKQELQKANKDVETKYSEIAELKKTKEILSQRVDIMEMHIIDLKEQIDASLGAESMVTSLAEVKLELEERVKLLEDEVNELEALEAIHEELIESNQELEMDLRDEIDTLSCNAKRLQHEKDEALEAVYDRDVTISKFRDLVKTLNRQLHCKDIASATSTSEDCSATSNPEETHSFDFNQIFTLTKAYGRSIDIQVNAVELKLEKMHIDYLLTFMSDDFLLRGKEHDVILVLLLLHRINEKLNIVCSAIKEKFPSSCIEYGKVAIFDGFSVHRFAFRSKCIFLLRSVKLVLQQLIFGLNYCDYELCTHAAIYRREIEAQEEHINELLRLLKNGLLDENSPIESIESTSSFFNALYTNLMSSQDLRELVDENQLHATLMEVFDVGLDCANTNANLLHTIIQVGDEYTESFKFMQFVLENMNQFKQKLKKLERRFSSSRSKTYINGNMQYTRMQHIQMTNDYFCRLINILAATARDAMKCMPAQCDTSGESCAIDHKTLWKIIISNCNKYSNTDDTQTPLAMLEYMVHLLEEQFDELFNFVINNENVTNTNVNTMCVRSSSVNTLLQRSAYIKLQFEKNKILKQTLMDREKEIKSLKYMAKTKQNEFCEIQIRKEMSEKQVTKSIKEQERAITLIIKYIENLENEMKCQKISMSKSLTALELKYFALEQTYKSLQKKLQLNDQSLNTTTNEAVREVAALRNCLRVERAERLRLQTNNMRNTITNFEPIFVPLQPSPYMSALKTLKLELQDCKNEWILSHITIHKQRWNNQKLNVQNHIKAKSNNLIKHIINAYFMQNPHRAAETIFGKFSTLEVQELFH